MDVLDLHDFHARLGARFMSLGNSEVVADYGDWEAEYRGLRASAVLLDLSGRSRVVLLGADRQRMLNGQVTNNVKDLPVGQGCYAALVTPKARVVSDLFVYALPNELLLDFEPGLSAVVTQRLEKFIVIEDVQIVDAAPHYGLLSVQGPQSPRVVEALEGFSEIPAKPLHFTTWHHPDWGDLYLMHQARAGGSGFDLFAPRGALEALAKLLVAAVHNVGGGPGGWRALEVGRIEAGIPRCGVDITESHLPPELGMDERMISYSKGCYSGQEVIARIRTYGQVAKALRGLRFDAGPEMVPVAGTKLHKDGKEVGVVTSAVWSPTLGGAIGLGYVRRECNQVGAELWAGAREGGVKAVVAARPLVG
jgi:aminomethyltransferase